MNGSWNNTKAFKWQYRLIENSQTRMRFSLPRRALFIIALLCISFGVVFLLCPQWFEKQSQFMILVSGGLCVFLGLSLFWFVITRSGEIIVDACGQFVAVNFRSPKEHISRHIPFGDFISIETRQIKDMHGLHNHWTIELVGHGDLRIRLGAGFNGTFRKRVRDDLLAKMSEMIGVPVEYLEGDR